MIIEYAVNYAEQFQWHVFPIIPFGKNPLVKNGFYAATTDVRQIQAWWTKHPTANIGVACGRSELAVVDLDGTIGIEQWNRLVESNQLVIPHCAIQSTASGGNHLIFKQLAAERIRNTNAKIAPKIDTRGDGGYILAAPSMVTYHGSDAIQRGVSDGYTGRYEWLDGFHPADGIENAPSKLLELLRPKEKKEVAQVTCRNVYPLLQKKYELVANAPVGARNSTLYKAAYFLAHLDSDTKISESDVYETMYFAARACGLPEREIIATLKSAIYGKQ